MNPSANPVDLIVRSESIEIVYAGRPLGGISGTQWFLEPTKTTMVPAPPGSADNGVIQEMVLTEVDEHGRPRVKLGLVAINSYSEVWNALAGVGVYADDGNAPPPIR